MIPRTFISVTQGGKAAMVVYILPSIAGKTAWIDYIPVKGVQIESDVLSNTYANDGYQLVSRLESVSGLQEWLNYIPVYEDVAFNKPWSTDSGGFIPVNRDEIRYNLEDEAGFNMLLEDGDFLLQEF